jgi:hypothetical protein
MCRAYSTLDRDEHCIENFCRKMLNELNVLYKCIEGAAVLKHVKNKWGFD